MFAKYLYREGVAAHSGKPELVFLPIKSIGQVWEALDALDGDSLDSLMVLERVADLDDDGHLWSGKAMEVACGKENEYYCVAHEADGTSLIGIAPNSPREKDDELIVIGQEDYYRHESITIDEAREALEHFIKRGYLTDALNWQPH